MYGLILHTRKKILYESLRQDGAVVGFIANEIGICEVEKLGWIGRCRIWLLRELKPLPLCVVCG